MSSSLKLSPPKPAEDRVWTGPNILSLSRLGWAVALFVCIGFEEWALGLGFFAVAALTDWLDGVWARAADLRSAIGRSLDPLIDKVLVCGAFIYLLPVPGAGLLPWMVTVVVGRELLITGLRGAIESRGTGFGADRLGKAKMVLQCAALVVILAALWAGQASPGAAYL
ncbi:MAG TPA: CDP-alcohol phosphatidyltransferase family protein, partial [Gemmataceae bacterium]